jgi:hypothetical protein
MAGELIQAAAQQALQPSLTVAQPMNDVQLLALVAASLSGSFADAKELVTVAVEVVAHSVVALKAGALAQRIAELARQAAEEQQRQVEAGKPRLYQPETPDAPGV